MCDYKAIVNMTNWELYVYDERYNLSGLADNHPSLGKSAYVSRTSSLVSYTYENEVLTYETRNTIYVCQLKYMTTRPYSNVETSYKEKLTRRSENSISSLDKLIEASAKTSLIWDIEHTEQSELGGEERTITDAKSLRDDFVTHIMEIQVMGQKEIEEANDAMNTQLIEVAKKYENCVYIEVSNIECGDKLAYHLGEYTGIVEPILHSGMFQDSILYMKYGMGNDECALDFRYFPKGFGNSIETYSWSDNIAQAVIKNACRFSIEFNHETIEMGETKVFTPNNHSQGLMSPDCYNGKMAFSLNLDEMENEDRR